MNDAPPPVRRLPFWLVLSLLANMLLIGLLAGVMLRSGPHRPGHMKDRDHFSWSQRDGRNEAIGQAFRQAYLSSEAERAARSRARQALGEAVARDPYDADAVRAAFETLRQSDDAVNEIVHEAMAERLADLSADERKIVAHFLVRGPDRDRGRASPGGPGDGRRMPPPDGPPPGPGR